MNEQQLAAVKQELDDLIAEYYMETSSFAERVDEIFKQAQPAVPEGWKLVPLEPTKEMAVAYWQFNDRQDVRMIDAWKAILEAAPEKGNT